MTDTPSPDIDAVALEAAEQRVLRLLVREMGGYGVTRISQADFQSGKSVMRYNAWASGFGKESILLADIVTAALPKSET